MATSTRTSVKTNLVHGQMDSSATSKYTHKVLHNASVSQISMSQPLPHHYTLRLTLDLIPSSHPYPSYPNANPNPKAHTKCDIKIWNWLKIVNQATVHLCKVPTLPPLPPCNLSPTSTETRLLTKKGCPQVSNFSIYSIIPLALPLTLTLPL